MGRSPQTISRIDVPYGKHHVDVIPVDLRVPHPVIIGVVSSLGISHLNISSSSGIIASSPPYDLIQRLSLALWKIEDCILHSPLLFAHRRGNRSLLFPRYTHAIDRIGCFHSLPPLVCRLIPASSPPAKPRMDISTSNPQHLSQNLLTRLYHPSYQTLSLPETWV